MQQQISRAAGRRIDFFDLNIILARFIAGNGGQDRRLAGLDLVLFCDRQRRADDLRCVLCRVLAEIRRAASAPLKAARVPAYAGIAGGTVELIASSCFLQQDEAFFFY